MKSRETSVQYTSGAKSRARNNRERCGVGKASTTNSARMTLAGDQIRNELLSLNLGGLPGCKFHTVGSGNGFRE